MARLLLLVVTYTFLSLSYQCDIGCNKFPRVPPRWTHQDNLVPNIALGCSVNGTCSLDIKELVNNFTQQLEQAAFLNIDLYLSCISADSRLGKLFHVIMLRCLWARQGEHGGKHWVSYLQVF